jgi:hypothetical protein
MFFTFPEDAHWNADRAVEFGVEIGEYRGVVRVPRRVFQRLLPERPAPERCLKRTISRRIANAGRLADTRVEPWAKVLDLKGAGQVSRVRSAGPERRFDQVGCQDG